MQNDQPCVTKESFIMNEWGMYASIAASVTATAAVGILLFQVGKWTGTIEESIKALNKSMGKVSGNISELRDDVKKIMMRLPSSPVSK